MSHETHVSALTDIYAAKISRLEKQNAELLRVLRIVENYAHFPGQNFSWDDVRAAVFDAVKKAKASGKS